MKKFQQRNLTEKVPTQLDVEVNPDIIDLSYLNPDDENLFVKQLEASIDDKLFKQYELPIWLTTVRKLLSARIEALPTQQISLYLAAVKSAQDREQYHSQ